MTESKRDNEAMNLQAPHGEAAGSSVYTYESAGIAERKGHIPIWLWLVVASLLVWGVYYLVTYWNAPVSPT